jgi:hypothetical protein
VKGPPRPVPSRFARQVTFRSASSRAGGTGFLRIALSRGAGKNSSEIAPPPREAGRTLIEARLHARALERNRARQSGRAEKWTGPEDFRARRCAHLKILSRPARRRVFKKSCPALRDGRDGQSRGLRRCGRPRDGDQPQSGIRAPAGCPRRV